MTKEALVKKIKEAILSSKFYGLDEKAWELAEEIERFIDDKIDEKLKRFGIK